ncbi:uncharacterized protein [Lepeophtheirus salmonis]|uniref:uncharacterized protein n=1 Tax=Lepeophtheirus salmonis TaxID=72036 RepID=UPI001AE8D6C2|nr:helix-loop-helix protein 3-like [Lepeophtheirus salmonis]
MEAALKRSKIKHPILGYAIPPPLPPKVARRNARERNRVKQVNSGFDYLKSHLPGATDIKKMSKVDTLRRAVDYIQSLQTLLGLDESSSPSCSPSSSSIEESSKKEGSESGYETVSPVVTPSSLSSPVETSSPSPSCFVFPTSSTTAPDPFSLSFEEPHTLQPSHHQQQDKSHILQPSHPHQQEETTHHLSSSTDFYDPSLDNYCNSILFDHHNTHQHHTPLDSRDDELLDVIAQWQES